MRRALLGCMEKMTKSLMRDIEMVQLIDNVEWSDNKVYIKLFAEWGLP
jgi:hypothetical protein